MATGTFRGNQFINGMTGEVWRDGRFQADIINFNGTITKDKIDVPVPGTRNTQSKGGRITREGTFQYQKVDDSREVAFLAHLQDLDVLRALRDAGTPLNSTYNVLLNLDDPEAGGASSVNLVGIEEWTLPLGFDITSMVTREISISWQAEAYPDGGAYVIDRL